MVLKRAEGFACSMVLVGRDWSPNDRRGAVVTVVRASSPDVTALPAERG